MDVSYYSSMKDILADGRKAESLTGPGEETRPLTTTSASSKAHGRVRCLVDDQGRVKGRGQLSEGGSEIQGREKSMSNAKDDLALGLR